MQNIKIAVQRTVPTSGQAPVQQQRAWTLDKADAPCSGGGGGALWGIDQCRQHNLHALLCWYTGMG